MVEEYKLEKVVKKIDSSSVRSRGTCFSKVGGDLEHVVSEVDVEHIIDDAKRIVVDVAAYCLDSKFIQRVR